MPTKDTGTVIARVKNETIRIIKQRARKRDITVNAWLNWAIEQALRNHRKRADNENK